MRTFLIEGFLDEAFGGDSSVCPWQGTALSHLPGQWDQCHSCPWVTFPSGSFAGLRAVVTHTGAVERGWMEMCELLTGAGYGSRVSRACCLYERARWDEIFGIYRQYAEVIICPFRPDCLQQCCHFLGLGLKAGQYLPSAPTLSGLPRALCVPQAQHYIEP